MSKYYRFNIIVMLFLAFLTVTLNLLFLEYTNLELLGIAIAYAVSMMLFNIAKIAFNYWKFKVSPLSIEMLYALILGFLAITTAIILPTFSNNLLNLVYKPAVVLAFFFVGNHFLKLFPLENYLNKEFFKSILKIKK